MDYAIFNVHTDVNACDCTRGCADTVRESALKVDSGGKNPSPHQGMEPVNRTCPTLYQPSYMPTLSSIARRRDA